MYVYLKNAKPIRHSQNKKPTHNRDDLHCGQTQPIVMLHDFQKLAKSGVPCIHILDIIGDTYFS